MLSVSNIYAFAMRTVLHQELEKPVSTPTKNTQQPMIMTVLTDHVGFVLTLFHFLQIVKVEPHIDFSTF